MHLKYEAYLKWLPKWTNRNRNGQKTKNSDAICAAQLQQSTINEAQQHLNKAIPLQWENKSDGEKQTDNQMQREESTIRLLIVSTNHGLVQ